MTKCFRKKCLLNLCIYALFGLIASTALSKANCNQVFSTEKLPHELNILDHLESQEHRINKLIMELGQYYSEDPRVNISIKKAIDLALKASQLLEHLEDRALNETPVGGKELNKLDNQLSELEANFYAIHNFTKVTEFFEKNSKIPWDDLIEDPGLIQPNKNYKLIQNDGQKLKINFSGKIVSEILRSNKAAFITAAKKAMSDAKKGIFGTNYQGTGIIKLNAGNGVLEIRSAGKDGGRFRFGGYLYDHVFYVVHWSNSGAHTSRGYKVSFREGVHRVRAQRGHQ